MLQDSNNSGRVNGVVVSSREEPRSLAEVGSKLKSAMGDAAFGPLIVAAEVVELAKHWKAFEAEAGDLSCAGWLQSTLGRGKDLAFFTRRHDAVKRLGEASRRRIHHDVAVYVLNNVTDEHLRKVKEMLFREYTANGKNPLTLMQAQPRIREVIGSRASTRKRTCKRCEQLKAILLQHGIDVPE